MSDLISRSELLKEIEKYKFGAISNDVEREYIKKTILDFIIGQPTAYDIDKVVEELKKRNQEYLDSFALHERDELYGVACGLADAIEIVKQGAVSDDVCEWEPHRNNYVTSCEEYFVPMMRGYKYCPYCGKKIKVV